ncbi:MAG: hypothetical protein KJT01_12625 [Gemmatimonadetes bacterium]|nr:hypothetical protein [Gemmatimonadota bacterium]
MMASALLRGATRGARVLLAVAAAGSAAGCAGMALPPFLAKPAAIAVAEPVERPLDAVPPAPSDPVDPDPPAAASDADGVARLQQLAFVWQLVAGHHPAVAAGSVPWDSALVRAVPRVRSAADPEALAAAYTRLLHAVDDPLTRVEVDGGAVSPAAAGAPAVTRTADSVLLVRLPPAPAYGDAVEGALREALRAATDRVVLDLRAASVVATPAEVPAAWSAELERLVERTGLASALAWRSTRLPVERSRVVGGSRSVQGAVVPQDGWRQQDGALLTPQGATPRRVVVVANPGTTVPRALLALVGSRQAVLVAEGGVRDDALVSSVAVPLAPGVSVRVRTGQLVHADGSVGIPMDTIVPAPAAAVAPDSAPAMVAARQWVRRAGAWPARRPVAPAAAPRLPRFFDEEPYPFLGARVLAGARLWAALRGRHAGRDQLDDDLDAAFAQALPALERARNATEYAAALRPLVAAFDDAQVALTGPSADSLAGEASAPFRVEAVEHVALVTAVVRDSLTRALGIEEGQEVTAADGFPLAAWRTEHQRDLAAPNPWTREERLLRLLPRGPVGGALFRLRDPGGRERQLNVPRRPAYRDRLPVLERPLTPPVREVAPGVWYADVERLPLDSVRAWLERARGGRAVVLDLRGRLPEPVASEALDRAVAPVAVRARATVAREVLRWRREPCLVAAWREAAQQCAEQREERPLEVSLEGLLEGLLAVSRTGLPEAGGAPSMDSAAADRAAPPRVVALIDARTQGAMERLAMRLEALADATFVGAPSAGSPSEVMVLPLPGGLTATVPLAEWRRPDGATVQRVGITPQVAAERTVRGVRAGRDEVLERAVQWLRQALDGPPARRRE